MKIYSTIAKIIVWRIPAGIMLCKVIAVKKINIKNTSVNIKSFDPCSSVFSQEALIDSNTLFSSKIIWGTNNENLADKYIPGIMSSR